MSVIHVNKEYLNIFLTKLKMVNKSNVIKDADTQRISSEIELNKQNVGRSKEVVNNLTVIQQSLLQGSDNITTQWKWLKITILLSLVVIVIALIKLYMSVDYTEGYSNSIPVVSVIIAMIVSLFLIGVSSHAQTQVSFEVCYLEDEANSGSIKELADDIQTHVKTLSVCKNIIVIMSVISSIATFYTLFQLNSYL